MPNIVEYVLSELGKTAASYSEEKAILHKKTKLNGTGVQFVFIDENTNHYQLNHYQLGGARVGKWKAGFGGEIADPDAPIYDQLAIELPEETFEIMCFEDHSTIRIDGKSYPITWENQASIVGDADETDEEGNVKKGYAYMTHTATCRVPLVKLQELRERMSPISSYWNHFGNILFALTINEFRQYRKENKDATWLSWFQSNEKLIVRKDKPNVTPKELLEEARQHLQDHASESAEFPLCRGFKVDNDKIIFDRIDAILSGTINPELIKEELDSLFKTVGNYSELSSFHLIKLSDVVDVARVNQTLVCLEKSLRELGEADEEQKATIESQIKDLKSRQTIHDISGNKVCNSMWNWQAAKHGFEQVLTSTVKPVLSGRSSPSLYAPKGLNSTPIEKIVVEPSL